MTPTMALAIHNALEREAATGRRAVVNARLVTITALAQRGWITAVSYYAARDGSGELTQAGRDAYARHEARDTYPPTGKQLEALRLVRDHIADHPQVHDTVQGSVHPRVFGVLRRRGWIAYDMPSQDYRLTEAGTAVLDQADEAGA